MKYATLLSILLLNLCVLMSLPAQAKTVYVTDSITITMRNGPSTKNKILKMVSSGTRLEIIDQASGWLKVATEDGTTGWVIKNYTMEQAPKDIRIQELQSERNTLRAENQEYQTELARLKKEMKTFQQTATDADTRLSSLKKRVAFLQNQVEQARKNDQRKWFLYGAGVVGGSALFGFVFGRIRRKQPNKLHF